MKTKLQTQNKEEFKETELGLLPKEWKVVKIQELVEFERGTEPGSENYNEKGEGVRFLRVSDISGKRTEFVYTTSKRIKLCLPEDVLITFDGSPGIVKRGFNGAYSSGIRKVKIISNNIDLDYTDYILQTDYVQGIIKKYSMGVTIKHASKSISHLTIPFPSLSEQKDISVVLTAVRQAGEKNIQVINSLKELKKSAMKHLFTYGAVRFEDIGKVKLKETEIGKIPAVWKVTTLGDVSKDGIKNGAFMRRERFGKGIIFLNVADTYKKLSVNLNDPRIERVKCTDDELRLYGIKKNDLFYVRSSLKRDGIGQCCIIEFISEPAIYDCHLMRVRPDENKILSKFLAYYSITDFGKQRLITASKTTTMTTINQQGLSSFRIPLPSLPEQEKIASILSTIDKKIQAEEQRKQALEQLFKSLLRNLMSGKIRVKDLKIIA